MTRLVRPPDAVEPIKLHWPPFVVMAGTLLCSIALLLPLIRGLVDFSVNGLSWTLLAICLCTAVAVGRTRNGFTGTVGLLFLTTFVFNMGRPLIWLFTQEDRIYQLNFGISIKGAVQDHTGLLIFWCSGVAGLFGGYFLRYRETARPAWRLDAGHGEFCRFAFWTLLSGVCILAPVAMLHRVQTFATGGYSALYANQAEYTFSWLRLADFLSPALFALAVVLQGRRYIRAATLGLTLYVLAGVVVGQRAGTGLWVLTAVWYLTAVSGRKISRWMLVGGGTALIVLFQVAVNLREGGTGSLTLLQFLVDQGITFMLPEVAPQVAFPPFHTILASFLPLGGVYSLLHIGTAETQSLGNYMSSQINQARFLEGFGLGGNFQLELYFASGTIMVVYAAMCVLGGLMLRKWEERASHSPFALFMLCLCIPTILFLPRGTISAVTSVVIYDGLILGVIYLIFQLTTHAVAGMRRGIPGPNPATGRPIER